jgi:hypothetical protein
MVSVNEILVSKKSPTAKTSVKSGTYALTTNDNPQQIGNGISNSISKHEFAIQNEHK